jgi:environmental stress-induced protein Ves
MSAGRNGEDGAMLIRRRADHVRMPWANGRGETLELAIHPAGASLGTFDWRISVATVSEPGPFSSLPGVDRVLLMLDDVDAVLQVDDERHTMRRFDQVAFSGDADVALIAVSAPAHDLNVMTRRGRWTARMRLVDLAAGVTGADAHALEAWLLVASGTAQVHDGTEIADLAELDLVRLTRPMVITGSGHGVLIDLHQAQQT